MPIHTIRLREPWRRLSVESDGVTFERQFHRPPLTSERVFVVCESPRCAARVLLDEAEIGSMQAGDAACSFDVTARLAARSSTLHRLTFFVRHVDLAGGDVATTLPWKEVRLEISASS